MSAPGLDAPPRRRPWQLNSQDLLLVVVAAALLLTVEVNRRRSADLSARIARLRFLGRELDQVDPRQLAAIGRPPEWLGEYGFHVFVPDHGEFRLCLATRAIDKVGLPAPQQAAPLCPGKHAFKVTTTRHGRGTRCVVLDGKEMRLAVEEPAGWAGAELHSSPWAARIGKAVRSPADRPLVLLRSRYRMPVTPPQGRFRDPGGLADGVMLWVERVAEGRSGRPSGDPL